MRHKGKGEESNGKEDAKSRVEESSHHPCRHVAATYRTSCLDSGDLCKVDARADVCQSHCAHLEESSGEQHWEVWGQKDGQVAQHGTKVARQEDPLSSKPLT